MTFLQQNAAGYGIFPIFSHASRCLGGGHGGISDCCILYRCLIGFYIMHAGRYIHLTEIGER